MLHHEIRNNPPLLTETILTTEQEASCGHSCRGKTITAQFVTLLTSAEREEPITRPEWKAAVEESRVWIWLRDEENSN